MGLFEAGLACWMLAWFFLTTDAIGFRSWSYPLVVVGMNSIAMYMLAQTLKPFIARRLTTHLVGYFDASRHVYSIDGLVFRIRIYPESFAPIVGSTMVLFVLWLICWWMYKNKFFVKI